MKTSAALLGAILALSVGVWTFFYFLAAGEPLAPPETLVIVGISAAVVVCVRWVWTWVWRGRRPHAGEL